MKYLLLGIIAVLAVFISQNEATPDYEMTTLYLKSREIRISLQTYKTRVGTEENKKFQNLSEFLKENSTEMINGILESAGIANNETCKKALESKLKTAHGIYLGSLGKCVNTNIPDWKQGKSGWNIDKWINESIAVGEAFEANIDKIRGDCFDHNAGVFEKCLEQYLPKLRLSIASYQADEAKLRARVQVKTGVGFMNCGVCFNGTSDNFTNKTDTAKEEALKCIKPT